jgi:hypothetical protein
MEIGLTEVARIETPSFFKKVSTFRFREVLTYVYCGVSLVVIIVLLAYFRPSTLQHLTDSKIERADIEIPMNLTHKTQLQRIKNALEIYYLEQGKYPDRIEDLLSTRLLQKDDLYYRKGVAYQYELKEGKYYLKH